MPKLNLHAALRGPTGGATGIEAPGDSVRACLEAVDAQHPGLLAQVVGPDGEPHRFVKLFVNGEPAASLDAPVAEGDEIEVLAAVGGG